MKRTCKQCGKDFFLSKSEIDFYKNKNLTLPKRCKECRELNKNKDGKAAGSEQRLNKSDVVQNTYIQTADGGYRPQVPKLLAVVGVIVLIVVFAIISFLSKDTNTIENISAPSIQTGSVNESFSEFTEAVEDEIVTDTDIDPDFTIETDVDVDPGILVNTDIELKDDTEETEPVNEQSGADESVVDEPVVDEQEVVVEPEVVVEEIVSEEALSEETPVVANYRFRNNKLLQQHYEKHGIEMGFASAQAYENAAAAVVVNPNALTKTEKEDGDYVYYVEATNEFVIISTDGYIRTYFNPSSGRRYYDKQ